MSLLQSIVWVWAALILLPTASVADDAIQTEKQNHMIKLKPGKLLRLSCDEIGRIGGRLTLVKADSIFLDADQRCNSYVPPPQRALRLSPAAAANARPIWRSVDQLTSIPIADVRELYVRSNAARPGALVGGITVSLLSLGLLVGLSSMDDGTGSNSGQIAGYTAVGFFIGAGLGAGIGAAIPTWRLEYRQPDYIWRSNKR